MPETTLKLEYAFICDDVRREDNGKFLFLGAYANNIGFMEFPGSLSGRIVLGIRVTKPPAHKIELKVYVDGEEVGGGTGTLGSKQAGFTFIVLPLRLHDVLGPGEFSLRFREAGLRWRTVLSMPITELNPEPNDA